MKTTPASSFPGPRKPHKPFTFRWTYPSGDVGKTIKHAARSCEVRVRDKDGKRVTKTRRVKAYTQVVR